METLEFINSVQIGNFKVYLTKESEYLIFSTVPTEDNNGGESLAVYTPTENARTYALIRAIYEQAVAGDNNAKMMLTMKSLMLMVTKDAFPVDTKLVEDVANAVISNYARIKKITDTFGSPENEEDALEELAEREEMENRLREYENMLNDGKDK